MFAALILLLLSINAAHVQAAIPITEQNRDYAESRIVALDENSYFINYSTDGNEYRANSSQFIGVRNIRGIGFYTIEIDGSIAQKITIIDNNTIEFTTYENPEHPYISSRVPLRLCMNNNAVKNARRFETEIPYCESDKEYYVGNILIGATYTVRLEESIYNTTKLIWWLGTDDLDGTYGQGGGLPTCNYKQAEISLNQTQTYVNSSFKFGIRYTVSGTGCGSVNSLEAQQYNNLPAWRMIPSNPIANTNLDCNGAICSKSSPTLGVWYYKTVKCNAVGNRSVRTAIFSSFDTNYNTPAQNMECLPIPTTEPPETLINHSFVPVSIPEQFTPHFSIIILLFAGFCVSYGYYKHKWLWVFAASILLLISGLSFDWNELFDISGIKTVTQYNIVNSNITNYQVTEYKIYQSSNYSYLLQLMFILISISWFFKSLKMRKKEHGNTESN